jgi:hypothetical protein
VISFFCCIFVVEIKTTTNMKTHFDNYELAIKSCGEALAAFDIARDKARSIVIDIVKKLQTEKGYVKFAYGHRPSIYGCDIGEITYIKYDYEIKELLVLSRHQNVKPENKKAKECWNMLRLECSPLCCYESIMRELRNIIEK